ncbi:hypothetical protein [Pontibacter litorisediminis]|uniref:hypothetical protein n=1 Tax=Pontibacter litorisediminis TaxID=1846260 RepID=UPI0023EBCF48|nr:hypothetical protein [Pontibacter litorisediminis]
MKTTTHHLLLLGVILLLASGFIQKTPTQDSYLIFGRFYKDCVGGECMKLYKLENNSLYEFLEDSTNYPSFNQFHTGDFRKLSQEKYNRISTLAASIPQELLEIKSGFVGKTDHNWSGYYIEYAKGGERKFWIFDEARRDVPPAYLPLLNEIEKSLNEVKQ